jgi:hypothetical protein
VTAVAVDGGNAAVDGVAARFFLCVGIRLGGPAFDRALCLDHASGVQQGFEQGGLARTGVAGERDVADVFRVVRHDVPPLAEATHA